MCISPILIKNPNYGHTVKNSYDVDCYMKNTTTQYIEIACGHCPECMILKQTYIRQRSTLMSRTHDIYFATLTYSPDMLPTMEVNGFKHAYADIRDFQNMVKYMRKIDFFGSPFKYIAVTEYGGKKHRPHFHVLFFVKKSDKKEDEFDIWNKTQFYYWALLKLWRRNVSTDINTTAGAKKRVRVNTRNAVYKPLCRYVKDCRGRSTYDFHQVIPRRTKNGVADVCTYVTKYVLKFDKWIVRKQQALHQNLESDEYKRVWNIIKPRILISKHFGDNDEFTDIVRRGIEYSISIGDKCFRFIDPTNGKVMPLAPYLRRKFATYVDFKAQYESKPKDPDNVPDLSDNYVGRTYDNKASKYRRTFLLIQSRNTDDFYELE